ncbi:HNH endonuclease [Schleiferilactobacillus harbinensis]|uniref:HNH endonuclease n=1 Tax=Schleiferilactobacillus harbinensis TaxID=304207 RepID=UPI001168AE73|nr:HNH endonuclease [Schleiferilactobacillus harbinensis]GEK06643.1 prophage pi1 protein 32 [Schleiferilactobacillus harbinensis]
MTSRRRRAKQNLYHECGQSLCHSIIPISERYCPVHKEQHDQEWQAKKDEFRRSKLGQAIKAQKTKQYDLNERDPEAVAFYHNKQWQRVRDYVYSRDMATDQVTGQVLGNRKVVDHIVPMRLCKTMADKLNPDNLWVLSYKTHYRKTKIEQIISSQHNGDIKLQHLNRAWWTKILKEKKEDK